MFVFHKHDEGKFEEYIEIRDDTIGTPIGFQLKNKSMKYFYDMKRGYC